MIFRNKRKNHAGATPIEVVRQLKRDEFRLVAPEDSSSLREFLEWSLKNLSDRLPPFELDSSPRLSDELRAQDYLNQRLRIRHRRVCRIENRCFRID